MKPALISALGRCQRGFLLLPDSRHAVFGDPSERDRPIVGAVEDLPDGGRGEQGQLELSPDCRIR